MTTNPQTQKKIFSKVSHFSHFPGIPTFNPGPVPRGLRSASPGAARPSRVAPLVPCAGHSSRAYIYMYICARPPLAPQCASPLGVPCPPPGIPPPRPFSSRFALFSVKGC